MASIKLKGDTSGELTIQAPSVAGTNTLELQATSGTLATTAQASIGMKNRIINGNMAIDQRNAGSSVTATGAAPYTLDRWLAYSSPTSKFTVQQNAGSVTPPVGFTNYLGAVSSSSYSLNATDVFVINQNIEGLNIANLAWGTANAKTVTLSFQVYSSLTGTFGGVLRNSADNRSYPFTYSIASANTWTSISVTVAGDTSGTWLTNNGVGIRVSFGLGVGSTYSGTAGAWAGTLYQGATGATSVVGTSGATFYITGVQLEVGETATPFEHLQYGQQLALCKRYYEHSYPYGTVAGTAGGKGAMHTCFGLTRPSGYGIETVFYTVEKRATATVVLYAYNGTAGSISNGDNGATIATADVIQNSTKGFLPRQTGGTTLAAQTYIYHYSASSEL